MSFNNKNKKKKIYIYGNVGDELYMLGNTWHMLVTLPLDGVYGEVCTCISCFNIIHGHLVAELFNTR